jgi:hypothetical protein
VIKRINNAHAAEVWPDDTALNDLVYGGKTLGHISDGRASLHHGRDLALPKLLPPQKHTTHLLENCRRVMLASLHHGSSVAVLAAAAWVMLYKRRACESNCFLLTIHALDDGENKTV